jgi:hypothetical protein
MSNRQLEQLLTSGFASKGRRDPVPDSTHQSILMCSTARTVLDLSPRHVRPPELQLRLGGVPTAQSAAA